MISRCLCLLILLASTNTYSQSKLDSLGIAPNLWRNALSRLAFTDTLRCEVTKTKMFRVGTFKDQIGYSTKKGVYVFSDAELLRWCYKKEEEAINE